jgi:hypothetical protein
VNTGEIDPGRLQRAVHLDVELLGDGRYLVTGGEAGHVVDPDGEGCDCIDYGRRHYCKHTLRVSLSRGCSPDLIEALRRIVPAPSRSGRSSSAPGGGVASWPTDPRRWPKNLRL